MKPLKALIIDFPEAQSLSQELKHILESASVPKLLIQGETIVDEPKLKSIESERVHRPADSSSDFVFFVLSGELRHRRCQLLKSVLAAFGKTPVFLVTDDLEPDQMLNLLRLGVADFMMPPLRAPNVLPRVRRFLENSSCEDLATQNLKEKLGLGQFIGQSPAFMAEIKKIPLFARCDTNVFISGETGTGKEMCARALHYLSLRADKPFVPVNCGAIPAELVENELFGHTRGAYTGAADARSGLVNEADGGTLFLDEIDSLPQIAQVKLLQFLQDQQYRPLGSAKARMVNVRLIAASNAEIDEVLRSGKLRRDFYYRLKVLTLRLPALRHRAEDIALLAQHFLEEHATNHRRDVHGFTPAAMQKLAVYDWPGNIRELEHVIERAVVLAESTHLHSTDLSLEHDGAPAPTLFREAKAQVVAQFEKRFLTSLLTAYDGNISRAAQAAGKNRRALWELMRKHHLAACAVSPERTSLGQIHTTARTISS